MFYLHWLLAMLDYNYQEHYWFAVQERKFQTHILSTLIKDKT